MLDKFVCVRVIQANGLDLARFQFDYDMSFAVLFFNADGTLYGRYGTRSALPKEADRDISLDGLRASLEGVLALHRGFPANGESLAAKTGARPKYDRPEAYPKLQNYKPALDYQGAVAKSCVHCHQIRDAERVELREAGAPISERVLFPWPMPDVVGLHLDRDTRATIARVSSGTFASEAGLAAGDTILKVNGQPIISAADVQWVLHNSGAEAELDFEVRRGDAVENIRLDLPTGWRQRSDISWRVSTWDLRRMVTGGILLKSLGEEEAEKYSGKLALRAEHVGQYGEHAVAKKAGVRKGDIVISWNGRSDPMTDSELIAFTLQSTKRGDVVPITVLRGDKELEFMLRMQ